MFISIAIPTYKRTDLLFESIQKIITDDRINEIVIVDDASPMHIYSEIHGFFTGIDKVKLYRNLVNKDCYFNKHEAVGKCTNQYILILDSDNVVDGKFIDTIFAQAWSPKVIMQPSFAKPNFDFTKYSNTLIHKNNVSKYLSDSSFTTMLNAFNLFVNRDEYLKVWDGSVDPVTSDSIYFNYKWLEAGNSIYVVPGLEYEHRVHGHGKEEGSHYVKNVRRTKLGFHQSIINKLKAMR